VTGVTPNLLITDDDLSFRETLRGVLEPLGFRTFMASDGEEALDVVRREEVHLVLLDMHMPRLTGLETLRLLKQTKLVLPCIILSANADDALREEARRANAFSVLSKPVSRLNLTTIVHNALQHTYNWSA
jgi:CheY-like chemotaxis protein